MCTPFFHIISDFFIYLNNIKYSFICRSYTPLSEDNMDIYYRQMENNL